MQMGFGAPGVSSLPVGRIIAVVIAAVLMQWNATSAKPLKTIYSFCANGCGDGQAPVGRLVEDAAGSLYGVTDAGGAQGSGTVFRLTPNADRTRWKEKIIYSFCTAGDCSAGQQPEAGLIIDTSGNLYGVSSAGPSTSGGAVFELMPNAKKTKWKLKVLATFCTDWPSCTGGKEPLSGLTYVGAASGVPYDGKSSLYGTTSQGGKQGQGIVFQLTKEKGTWTHQTIYDFCAAAKCTDGALPIGDLIVDASGNLYGAANAGGAFGFGSIYEIKHARGPSPNLTVLHSFCALANCADGDQPEAGVIIDGAGNLFGTTALGGSSHNGGTVYKIVPSGSNSDFIVLHTFCEESPCNDGAQPYATVTADVAGNLLGTTYAGGKNDAGAIFELHPNGDLYDFTNVYNFCQRDYCPDGAAPKGPLFIDFIRRIVWRGAIWRSR